MTEAPFNWAGLCAQHTAGELMHVLKLDSARIDEIAEATGIAPRQRCQHSRPERLRAIPADFAAVAPTMNCHVLTIHYKARPDVIHRWAKEAGVTLLAGRVPRQVPPNWAELCADNTATAIKRQLVCDYGTIRRWARETGIFPKPAPKGPQLGSARQAKRPPTRAFPSRPGNPDWYAKGTFQHDNRTKTIWDDAADVLRAERWAVHRCSDKGRYDEKGRFWRVGNVVVTPDELLQRAERVRRKAG